MLILSSSGVGMLYNILAGGKFWGEAEAETRQGCQRHKATRQKPTRQIGIKKGTFTRHGRCGRHSQHHSTRALRCLSPPP